MPAPSVARAVEAHTKYKYEGQEDATRVQGRWASGAHHEHYRPRDHCAVVLLGACYPRRRLRLLWFCKYDGVTVIFGGKISPPGGGRGRMWTDLDTVKVWVWIRQNMRRARLSC